MSTIRPLEGQIAVVAGATRGAGRGIACMLGEAGATVYCTGRSVWGSPPADGPYAGRPETIEETAEMVTAWGGVGIPVRVGHLVLEQVEALFRRVRQEQTRLDILVNDMSEGVLHDFRPFWKVSLEKGFQALRQGVHSHIITSRCAAPLMIERRRGLIVEITDGDFLGYHGTLFYDLVKTNVNRLAYAMANDLYKHGVAAMAVTPGYMRTESILEYMGVTEENWRDGARKDKNFLASETPCFVGRAVVALAADPKVMEKTGGVYGSWTLSDEYGFIDVDGRRPHWGRHFEEVFGGRSAGGRLPIEWALARRPSIEAPAKRPRGPLKGRRSTRPVAS